MKRIITFTCLAALLLSSCEKHKALLKEVAKVEAEIQQANTELQALDAKFAALGTDPYVASSYYKRQHVEWQQKNAGLQQYLAALTQRCTSDEKVLKDVRSMIDAYLARR